MLSRLASAPSRRGPVRGESRAGPSATEGESVAAAGRVCGKVVFHGPIFGPMD